MAINVNRNVDDVFYRYKMPRLIAKVEGKGNGIKTVIANMTEIAKALHRPPTYPTKYFGCELGAQTQFDLKNDRYIVNGEHEAQKLQEILDGFIKKFVLCAECENPETTLKIKGSKIYQTCKACGHACTVDPRHKLSTFILKNPPEAYSPDAGATNNIKRGRSKKGKDAGSSSPAENGHAENDEVDDFADDAPGSNEEEGELEDWSVDPEAVEERQKELAAGMASLTLNTDLEKSVEERLDMFYNFILTEKSKGNALDSKMLVAEAERLDVKDKAVLLLCRVLFDKNMLQEIKPNRVLLLRFVYDNHKAQRYLLGGIEQLICSQKEALLDKIPHILKSFYDQDILDEDVLLEWGAKSSKKYVSKEENKLIRNKAQPFLTWLKEAEEESESSENDVEVVYDDGRKQPSGPATQQQKQEQKLKASDGENDDFNIDDI